MTEIMYKIKKNLIIYLMLVGIFSCKNEKHKTIKESEIVKKKELKKKDNSLEDELKKIPKDTISALGYRFVIEGDFNGDGEKEKLIEHYYSQINNKETNKFYENLPEFEQLIALIIQKNPKSFLTSSDSKINNFEITNINQQIGLSFLKNEGDLNGDGTDDISYVINFADYSNCNTWHIATYKNNKWKDIYKFSIWDWQLPDLPQTFNNYGLFGIENKIVNTQNDSINKITKKKFNNFKGLIKKINNNKIKIIYKTDEAEEASKIVNLKN